VAVIRAGTVPGQRTVTGSLASIAEVAQKEKIRPPAIIVVGEVVGLRKELNWFEQRPLFGKRIVVTRSREQASEFTARLSDLGAECVEFPTIEVTPPPSWKELDGAIGNLETYQWLVFTSVNGVKYFFDRLEDSGQDARNLKGIQIAAIGPKTADAIREKGVRPDLVPEEYRAEAVVEAFRKRGVKGLRILLPRAAEAREVLPQELERMGAAVEVVAAYRTVRPKGAKDEIRDMLEKGDIHMVTFTSSSTVSNFMGMFEEEGGRLLKWMEKVKVACIGPVTAKTAKERGLSVHITPPDYTIEALAKAIVDHFTH
jgi:uroporphyrinogen III methyltransferase/synthase